MVRFKKILLSAGICLIFTTCQKQILLNKKSYSLKQNNERIIFQLDNDSLYYSFDPNFGFKPQYVKFRIINNSNDTLAFPFNDEFFLPFEKIEYYDGNANRRANYENNYINPLLRIIDSQNRVVEMSPGGFVGATTIKDITNKYQKIDEYVSEKIIILKPKEEKQVEIPVTLPIYIIKELIHLETKHIIENSSYMYEMFEKDKFDCDVFIKIDSSWIKDINESKMAILKKENIKLFTGEIVSNRIPVVYQS